MAGLNVGGPFNVANNDSNIAADQSKYIHYVPLNKSLMIAIHDFYMRGDPMITRANAIRSDQAFGNGYFLEWAESQRIMPDDGYDYRSGLQAQLEQARMWRDMFGFVAFVRPARTARTQLERHQEQSKLKPSEIAAEHRDRCMDEVSSVINTRKRSRAGADVDPDEQQRRDEVRRINVGTENLPATPRRRPTVLAREISEHNGNALTVSDSRIELINRVQAEAKRERTAKRQNERATTLMDLLVTIESVKIVDVDSGEFWLEIDEMFMNRRVVWVPNYRSSSNVVVRQGSPTSQVRFVDYDPNVEVFVWPDRWPTNDGIIKTDFVEILRLREMLREVEDNAMDADWQASHPTPFIHQTRPASKTDVSELMEEDMYAEDIISADSVFQKKNMSPNELVTYKRDVRDSLMIEATVAAAQNKNLASQMNDIAMGMARATRATRGGLSVPEVRAGLFEKSGIMHLTNGLALGGTVIPKPVAQVNEYREVYNRNLSIALGIPLSFLRGEQLGRQTSTGSKSAVAGDSSHSSSVTESIVRTTVMRDRDESSAYFDTMYDVSFRDSDTSSLETQLADTLSAQSSTDNARQAMVRLLQEHYDTIQDIANLEQNMSSLLSESARLCGFARETRRIISLRRRLRLKFVKAPFIEQGQVQEMYEFGALSRVEAVNIMRQGIGLEKLDEAEVKKLFDESLQVTSAKAEAETFVPPVQPVAKSKK